MAFRRGGPLLGAVVPAVSCVGADAGGAGDADVGVGGGGSPEQLARNAVAVAPASRWRREVFALILLVTGLPPILGWLAGVGLLLWSTRQKLLGILVWQKDPAPCPKQGLQNP
jgi:hypothetical protein